MSNSGKWFVIAALCFLLGYLGAQWFSAPARQINSVAEFLGSGASKPVELADRSIWSSTLMPISAGGRTARSNCDSTSCYVEVSNFYLLRDIQSGQNLSISVKVELVPEHTGLDRSWYLPSKTNWQPVRWTWDVDLVLGSRDQPLRSRISGTFAELENVPRFDGSDAIPRYVQALGLHMRERIAELAD